MMKMTIIERIAEIIFNDDYNALTKQILFGNAKLTYKEYLKNDREGQYINYGLDPKSKAKKYLEIVRDLVKSDPVGNQSDDMIINEYIDRAVKLP